MTILAKHGASHLRPIQLTLLGSFTLNVNQQPCEQLLSYGKARLLLVMLVLADGQPYARDELATQLWPDTDLQTGLSRLRHALHLIRKSLTTYSDALQSQQTLITLQPELVSCDVLRILKGNQQCPQYALELLNSYNGALLAGVRPLQTDWFDNWLRDLKTRLDIELALCRQLVIHHDQANTDLSLRHAQQWVRRWPEDESCHRLLIRLLLKSGQSDAANTALEHCIQKLRELNGTSPTPETLRLFDAYALTPTSSPRTGIASRNPCAEYAPLATVAITLRWQESASQTSEYVLAQLERQRQHLLSIAQRFGGWATAPAHGVNVIYFGYPKNNERPAELAARYAQHLSQLPLSTEFVLGIGLHANVALLGNDEQPDLGGLVSQTAIQLAFQARNQEPLLSPAAAHRLANWHLLELTKQEKTVYRLVNKLVAQPPKRLHGRTQEFEILVSYWRKLRTGNAPTIISLNGQPGIGKSFLLSAIQQFTQQAGAFTLNIECEEHEEHLPLHPIRNWLLQRLNLNPENTLFDSFKKTLQTTLGLNDQDSEPLSHWLYQSVDIGVSSSWQISLIVDLLCQYLHTQTSPSSSLFISIDNHQWCDEGTKSLVQQLKQQSFHAPSMIILSGRNSSQDYITADHLIHLSALKQEHTGQLVATRLRGRRLRSSHRQNVIYPHTGIPLLAVELLQHGNAHPNSIQSPVIDDLCCSLLNELSTELRQLIFLWSILPAEEATIFAPELYKENKESLQFHYSSLQQHGLLSGSTDKKIICHPLIQNAVRRIIPRRERQILHRNIAQYLLTQSAPPARIAEHLEAAEDPRAAAWWQEAASHSLQEHALEQAQLQLRRASELIQTLPTGNQREKLEFEHRLAQGVLTSVLSGPGSIQTSKAYNQLSIHPHEESLETQWATLWGRWIVAQNRGERTQALGLVARLKQLALNTDNAHWRANVLFAQAQDALWQADAPEAETLLREAVNITERSSPFIGPLKAYGTRPTALIYACLALAFASQGKKDAAISTSATARSMAKEGRVAVTQAICLVSEARMHYVLGDLQQSAHSASLVVETLPNAALLEPWFAIAQSYMALPQVLYHADHTALPILHQSVQRALQGMPITADAQWCLLARAQIGAWHLQDALQSLQQAERLNQRLQIKRCDAEIAFLKGDAYSALGQHEQALFSWKQASQKAQQLVEIPLLQRVQQRLLSSQHSHIREPRV